LTAIPIGIKPMTTTANVVDSSGWLEFFAGGPNAETFAKVIDDLDQLIVPTVTLLEVRKRLLAQRGPTVAHASIALMLQGLTIPLDEFLAIESATISLEEKLPLADSIILATARRYGATVWTMDSDFERCAGVRYVPRKS